MAIHLFCSLKQVRCRNGFNTWLVSQYFCEIAKRELLPPLSYAGIKESKGFRASQKLLVYWHGTQMAAVFCYLLSYYAFWFLGVRMRYVFICVIGKQYYFIGIIHIFTILYSYHKRKIVTIKELFYCGIHVHLNPILD